MMDRLLAREGDLRQRLNRLQAQRARLDAECQATNEQLLQAKRDLYAAGFKGNIMRDEFGNRRDVLPEPKGRKAKYFITDENGDLHTASRDELPPCDNIGGGA